MLSKVEMTKEINEENISYGLNININDNIYKYRNLCNKLTDIEQLILQLDNKDISEAHIDDIIRDFIVGNAYDRIIINNNN